jgi:hypothetical protein
VGTVIGTATNFWGLSVMISSSYHQTGTATSSPSHNQPSQSDKGLGLNGERMNIANVMLWMMKNAYEKILKNQSDDLAILGKFDNFW